MRARDLSNVFLALGRLGLFDEVLMSRLCKEAVAKAADFNSQDIANTIFSLSCLQHGDRTTMTMFWGMLDKIDLEVTEHRG